MIEADFSPEQIREDAFEVFMEQAVPDFLGISLDELRDTYEYRQRVAELRERQERLLFNSQDLDRVIYSPVVTITFRDLKNEVPETDINARMDSARDTKPQDTALIESFGQALLEQIASNLPRDLEEAADAWKGASEAEKVDILKFVYDRCLSRRWARFDKDEEDGGEKFEKNALGQQLYVIETAHPDTLAQWPNSDPINCLGMSLLLTGFAYRSGADFMYVNTIYPRRLSSNEIIIRSINNLADAMQSRGLHPNGLWRKYLDELDQSVVEAELAVQDFHHAICINTGKGWFHIDPFQLNFSDHDSFYAPIGMIYGTLEQTKRTFPGRTVLDTDSGTVDVIIDAVDKEYERLGYVSDAVCKFVRSYQDARPECEFDELLNALRAFDLRGSLVDKEGDPFKLNIIWQPDEWLRKVLISATLEGLKASNVDDTTKPADLEPKSLEDLIADFPEGDFRARFVKDKELRDEILNGVMVYPLLSAHQTSADMSESFTDGNAEPDTTLEFGDPAFMAAIFALNHLRVWGGYGNKHVSTVLAGQTSSQITWHEAMADTAPDISPTMLGIEQSLRTIIPRMLHERVSWRLFLRDHEGGEKDGQVSETSS